MSKTTNKTILGLLTVLSLFLTAFQGVIPTMPITDPNTIMIVSGIVLFLVNISTVWKQYLSEDIANKAIKRTLIVAVIATVAGVADLFNVFHLSDSAGQWVRFGFTVVALFLNLLSSALFPSEAAKMRSV